jgi:hypothetical protein
VPVGGGLLPHRTVEDNVAYGPFARDREHRRAAAGTAARLLQVDLLLGLPAGGLSPRRAATADPSTARPSTARPHPRE